MFHTQCEDLGRSLTPAKALPLFYIRLRLELSTNVREHCYPDEYIEITFVNAKGFAMVIITLRYSVKVKTDILITGVLLQ